MNESKNLRSWNKFLFFSALCVFFIFFILAAPAFCGISSSDPSDGETGVSTVPTIIIDLTESIIDTPAPGVNILKQGGTWLTTTNTTWSVFGGLARITINLSSNLNYNTTYTIDLANITNAGLQLTGTTRASFTTRARTVSISSSSPASGSTNIDVNTRITVNFQAACDTSSVPSSPLTNRTTGRSVSGAVSFSNGNQTVTFTPSSALDPNTTYILELRGTTFYTGTVSLSSPTSFTFTTAQSNQPARISSRVSPSNISMPSDGVSSATFYFTEGAGTSVNITSGRIDYLTSSGTLVKSYNTSDSFAIRGSSTTTYSERIQIPQDVKSQITGNQLIYRRYFYGTDRTNQTIIISNDINITFSSDITGTFNINQIIIDTPVSGNTYLLNTALKAHAYIKGTGSGNIYGAWYKDNIPIKYFNTTLDNGNTLSIDIENPLFTNTYGNHNLKVILQTPNIIESNSISYLVSSTTTEKAVLTYPSKGQEFKKDSPPPTFYWTAIPRMLGYKIAISNKPSFKKEDWIKVPANYYSPSSNFWKNLKEETYYWAVIPINIAGEEGIMSDVFTFKIIKKEDVSFYSVNTGKKHAGSYYLYNPDTRNFEAASDESDFFLSQNNSQNNSSEENKLRFEGTVTSNYEFYNIDGTRWSILNKNSTANISHPLPSGNISFNGNWADNSSNPVLPMTLTNYVITGKIDRFDFSYGDLAYSQSEFSIYSQATKGTTVSTNFGNSKIAFHKLDDQGYSPYSATLSGTKKDISVFSIEPFKTKEDEVIKLIYLGGREELDGNVPDYGFNKPKDGKVLALVANKKFINDKLIFTGEFARGSLDNNTTAVKDDTDVRDNAANFRITGKLGSFKIETGYRSVGANFGTLGNPYLVKDKKIIDYVLSAGWGIFSAKTSFELTSNNLDSNINTTSAYSRMKKFEFTSYPSSGPSINYSYSKNMITGNPPVGFGNGTFVIQTISNAGINWMIKKLGLNFNFNDVQFDDLQDFTNDTSTHSATLGSSYSFGEKLNTSINYSSNITRNLVTCLDNLYNSLYVQTNYTLTPKFNINISYNKNYSMSGDGFTNNNTDQMIARLNYSMGKALLGYGEHIISLEYNFNAYTDYVNTLFNTGYNKARLLLNDTWKF